MDRYEDPVWRYLGYDGADQPSWHFFPLISALSPCTATLEQPIERWADFNESHYKQNDKSLNEVLWKLFPTKEKVLQSRISEARRMCFLEGGYGAHDAQMRLHLPSFVEGGWGEYPPDRQRMIGMYERERIASNVRLANDLILTLMHAGWLPSGPSPMEILSERARANTLCSMHDAAEAADGLKIEGVLMVRSAKARAAKDDINRKGIARGISRLVDALLALWPWSSSPLIMDAATAFESLSRVEHSVWFALFSACAALHDPELLPGSPGAEPLPTLRKQGPLGDLRYAGLTFARLCALSIVSSPYVDSVHLNRAYYGIELTSRFFPFLAHEGAIARRGITHRDMQVAVAIEGWAHRDCIGDHYSCQEGKWPEGEMLKLQVFRRSLRPPWSSAATANSTPWWLGTRTPPVRTVPAEEAVRLKAQSRQTVEAERSKTKVVQRAATVEPATDAKRSDPVAEAIRSAVARRAEMTIQARQERTAKTGAKNGMKLGDKDPKKPEDVDKKQSKPRPRRKPKNRHLGTDDTKPDQTATLDPRSEVPVSDYSNVTTTRGRKSGGSSTTAGKASCKPERDAEEGIQLPTPTKSCGWVCVTSDSDAGLEEDSGVSRKTQKCREPTPFPTDLPAEEDELDSSDDSAESILFTPTPSPRRATRSTTKSASKTVSQAYSTIGCTTTSQRSKAARTRSKSARLTIADLSRSDVTVDDVKAETDEPHCGARTPRNDSAGCVLAANGGDSKAAPISPGPDWANSEVEYSWFANLSPEIELPALAYPTRRVELEAITHRRVNMGPDLPFYLEKGFTPAL